MLAKHVFVSLYFITTFIGAFRSIQGADLSADATYLGCFKEDPSDREFFVGSGNYNFNDILPTLCKALCKATDYEYAALQWGYMCVCSNAIETHSDGSLSSECYLRCAGNPTFICGGYGYSSVYSTSTSVKTLKITDPGYLEVFQVHTIETTLGAGADGALYRFNFGDNTGIAPETPEAQPHIFNTIGVYLVQAWVRNADSGSIEARREVYVEAPISDLHTKCDPYVEVDYVFKCSSRVGQGTDITATWIYNDGTPNDELNIADAARFNVGPIIPRRLSVLEPALELNGIYMTPSAEVLQHGSIEAWELVAVKAGEILLQVYRPLCGRNEKYCSYNRTCISKFWACPPPTEQFCDMDTTAFCIERGSCQPFTMQYLFLENNVTEASVNCTNLSSEMNSTYSNSSVNGTSTNTTQCPEPYTVIPEFTPGVCLDYNDTQDMVIPYQLVREVIVTVDVGYNMIPLDVSQRVKVKPHDWIGYAPYHRIFPSYYPKAAYPAVGEIAHFVDDRQHILFVTQADMQYLEMDIFERSAKTLRDIGLYLKAYISVPSSSWVSHIYTSSGLFEVNTQYTNPLGVTAEGPARFVKSEYAILSIQGMQFTRGLGIYYACTDEPYPMHVEITQGTFVQFLWTFPDRSQNLTSPYKTNGIVDGPEVKTPDSLPYHFDKIGNYTTNVLAYNDVSSKDVDLFTISRYRITGLNGSIVLYPGDNTTNDWNLVMSGCWFNYSSFILTGNVVQYIWDHGDDSTTGDWSFDTIHQHYYAVPGVYTVEIRSDNIASVLDHTFDVTAMKPNFVRLDEYATSEIPTLMFCEVTWHTGVGLEFHWDFGDGNSTVVFDTGLVWHNYSTYAVYEVECTIINYPEVSDTNSIIVQDPVEGVVLENKTKIEATGDEVNFKVTWTRGNDVHFDWYFGDGIIETTEVPTVNHIYLIVGYFEVTVNVANMVSSMISNPVTVELQERITTVAIESADNLILFPVHAAVLLDTGNKVWYDYDFGDKSREMNSPSNNVSHQYLKPDVYTIDVHAHNAVSSVNATTSVQIDSRLTGAVIQAVTPHVRADVLQARCVALNGSSVVISYDWGDGHAEGPMEAEYRRELSYSDFTASHTYDTEGTFNITCFMENPWSTKNVVSQVIVQEAIQGVPFLPSITVKGEIFDFEVLPFIGGTHSVLFRWDYNDGLRYTTQDFTHQYVYRNAGMYRVSLKAENLVSEYVTTQDFFVQEYISGFTLLHSVAPVEPGNPTIISWQIEYGTDVTYIVDLGDNKEPQALSQTNVGNMYTLQYVYDMPGSYLITVVAQNKLNSMNGTDLAYVEFPIQGLKAFIRGNSTTHTDRSSYIIIEIEQGTNVEYVCDYHDGSMPIVTKRRFCKHMFIDLGPHVVTVKASNHLSEAYIFANETYLVLLPPIPHVIRGLEIDVAEATILGEPTYFMMYRYRGNKFNCTWLFGDNTTMLTDITTVDYPVIHTYPDIGVYGIWLTCNNFFHPPVHTTAEVTIQVPPRGLNMSSGFVGKYGSDMMFTITLDAGTDVESVLNYTGYMFPVNMTDLDGDVIVPARYVNQSGWLDVVFTAYNLVPPILTLTQSVYIEAEVTGLQVWTDTPYVTIGSIVTFYAKMASGTNVNMEWSFGTNQVLTSYINMSSSEIMDSKQHIYTELGLYALYVIAYNEIGTITHIPVLVAVEDSVKGFSVVTDSPVEYPNGVVTFHCYWDTLHQVLPTNATVKILFGEGLYENPVVMTLDSIENIKFYRDYNDLYTTDGCDDIVYYNPFCDANFTATYMSETKLQILTLTHPYTPGVYTFSLSVYNLASQQVLEERVETQVPMVNLTIVTHNSASPGVAHGAPGGGPLRNFFPIEYPVHFEVRLDLGTGNRYLWQLGDGGSKSTDEMHMEYRYYRAKDYTVRLLSSNVFGMMDTSTKIYLQQSVIGLFAAHSGQTPMNKPVTVILFVAQVGTSATYTLKVDGTNNTYVMTAPAFGEDRVNEALDIIDPNIYLPFDPHIHAITFQVLQFDIPGKYLIELTGSNLASSLNTTTTVHITEEPCQLPVIIIYGGSKNVSNPWRVKKSDEITLISDVHLNCSRTYTASFHWDAYIVAWHNDKPLPSNQLYQYKLPADIPTDESDLVIARRRLDYATYLFQLTVTMINEGKVSNKNQTYVEVIPSPMYIRIAGGLSVNIQENATVVLNASASYDPDQQTAEDKHIGHSNQTDGRELGVTHGLHFEWFCKLHQNGSFSFDHGYIPSEDRCSDEDLPVFESNDAVLMIPLNNLTESSQFIFAVVVSTPAREPVMVQQKVYVLASEPPQLDIRCVRNCKYKVNPQKDLALAVDCSNCRNDTRIHYEWTIRYSKGLQLQSIPQYQQYIIGHQSRYIQLHPMLFTDQSNRVLSVSVRGDWTRSRSYGNAEYEFIIGGTPVQGNCTIEPQDGVALKTQFIIECTGFDSIEKPLHYEYLYSTGQASIASVSSYTEDYGTSYSILFHSPEGTSPGITLPMGLSHREFIVDIRVHVMDGIGASVLYDTHVKVTPPDMEVLDQEITSLKNENGSNSLSLFLGKGDTQSATKLLTTIAMVLNEDDDDEPSVEDEYVYETDDAEPDVETDTEIDAETDMDTDADTETDVEIDVKHDHSTMYKTEVRAMIVDKLSEIPVHNLDAAKQKSAAITQAILKPNELDPQTQTKAADAYLGMLDILEEESKEGTSLDIIEDASKNFFSGAFSLLEASSGQASVFYRELQDDPDAWSDFWDAREVALNDTDVPVDVPTSLGLVSDINHDFNVPDMDEIEKEQWVPEKLQISRDVTKKVFQIIDQISSTLLKNKLPGEPALVIQTDSISLILKKENLDDKRVRLYQTSDGTWFKLPIEAMEAIRDFFEDDDIISQVFSSPDNPFSWHLSAYEVKTSVIGLTLKDSDGNPLLVSDLSSRVEMLIPHIDDTKSVQNLGTADVNSQELSFFHFNLTDSHTSIHIDIEPTDGSSRLLEAWIRYGFWPTEKLYDLKLTLPLPSEGLYSSVYNTTTNMTTNPYTWFIAENQLYAIGSYYIGVRVKESEDEKEFFSEQNYTAPKAVVNIDVKIYTARCLYWSDTYEQWFPYGCEVGTLTTASLTHCLCNHLTSFGGSFLIPPKKRLFIEEEVIIFIELKETQIIFYAVSGAGGLFLLCVFFASIADNRHKNKIFRGVKLPGNCYIVKVFTGMEYNASTTAKVSIILHTSDTRSYPHHLVNKDNLSLRSGSIDTYVISTKKNLGKLTKISLFHDGGGFSPAWHISRVQVEKYTTGEKYHFLCNTSMKQSSDHYSFLTATGTMLSGKMHLFDTVGTSERFGTLVPLWRLVSRPLLAWVDAVDCIVAVFAGVFASMIGVMVLNEFLFPPTDDTVQEEEPSWIPETDDIMTAMEIPTRLSTQGRATPGRMLDPGSPCILSVQEEEPSWIPETDNIMTGIQAAVMALPVQYILIGLFSTVRRRIPTCCLPTFDEEDNEQEDMEESQDEIARETRRQPVRKPVRPKKQASLEEVTVEVPRNIPEVRVHAQDKDRIAREQVRGQDEDEGGRKVNHKPPEVRVQAQGQDEGGKKMDHTKLAPMDGLHRLQRSLRQLSRRSIAKHIVTNVGYDDSDSVDSFESVQDTESDSDYSGSFSDVPSGIQIDIGDMNQNANNTSETRNINQNSCSAADNTGDLNTGSESDYATSLNDAPCRPVQITVGNANQNANYFSEFNPLDLPDVVLATKTTSGPVRWSLLRHRKQSHLADPAPVSNVYVNGTKGSDVYSGHQHAGYSDKRENRNTQQHERPQQRQKPNATKKLPPSKQRQQHYAKDMRSRTKSSNSPYSKKRVENLSARSNREPTRRRGMTAPPEVPTTPGCFTRFIECWIQCIGYTCLPWCCSILLYPFVLAVLGGAGFMTIYFTLAYHEGLAYKWVIASAIAIVISNILIPPVLGIVVSIFSCLCRKPGSLSTTSLQYETSHKAMFTKSKPGKNSYGNRRCGSKLLCQHKLKTSPVSTTGIRSKVKVLLHMVVIAITIFVVYTRHDHQEYYWNRAVKDMFVSGRMLGTRPFSKVHTAPQFWDWANNTLLPTIGPVSDSKFPYDHLILLQMPRMRQFRVNQTLADKCPKLNILSNWMTHDDSCDTTFTNNEDRDHYMTRWEPSPPGSSNHPNGYHYFTAEEVQGTSYKGTYGTYPGGGYTCQLGMRSPDIRNNINKLSKDDWINGNTRSVFLEFIICNTQVNLTTMVQVVLEMLPTGVAASDVNIMTVADMGVVGYYWWWWWVYTSMQVGFGLVVVAKLVHGVTVILEHGREYLTSLTHLLSFFDLLLSIASAGGLSMEYMTQGQESYYLMSFADHQQMYWLQNATLSVLACLVFVSSWHILLFLRVLSVFEPRVYILRNVLYETCKALPMYAFAIIALAYPGWLQFSGVTKYFHSMWATVRSLHNLLLGGLYWDAVSDPTMPYFIMCFQVVVHFIVLIAVCAVVMQTYSSTRVQETLNQFINFGKTTKLARIIRNRIVTKRILRNVRLRKAIIARGWRRGRNSIKPQSRDRQLIAIKRRTDRLLKIVYTENDTLFKDPKKLVKISQMVVEKNA